MSETLENVENVDHVENADNVPESEFQSTAARLVVSVS